MNWRTGPDVPGVNVLLGVSRSSGCGIVVVGAARGRAASKLAVDAAVAEAGVRLTISVSLTVVTRSVTSPPNGVPRPAGRRDGGAGKRARALSRAHAGPGAARWQGDAALAGDVEGAPRGPDGLRVERVLAADRVDVLEFALRGGSVR